MKDASKIIDTINRHAKASGVVAAPSDPTANGGWSANSQRGIMLHVGDGTGWCPVPKRIAYAVAWFLENHKEG